MYCAVDISVDVGLQECSFDVDGAIVQVVPGCVSDDHAKSTLAHYTGMCFPVVNSQHAFEASLDSMADLRKRFERLDAKGRSGGPKDAEGADPPPGTAGISTEERGEGGG